MLELSPDESRVLGVLIEKSLTTPEQYPLSLNAVVNGANQKNNREPVISMTEDQAHQALEGLRGKGLVVRIDIPGNRVPKYRHEAQQTLHARTGEVAILAELLLRGPQTLGELRGRASRMHPMETLESARDLLRALTDRDEPLIGELPPAPGTRSEKYTQLLCPDLHPFVAGAVPSPALPSSAGAGSSAALSDRVSRLEEQIEQLQAQLRSLADALGHPIDTDAASDAR